MDILLTDGDITLGDGTDLVLVGTTTEEEDLRSLIAQRIKITLEAQQGEYLWDTTFGVPYLQEILVKDPDLTAIGARLTSIILAVKGVLTVDEIRVVIGSDRQATVTGTVHTEAGAVSLA